MRRAAIGLGIVAVCSAALFFYSWWCIGSDGYGCGIFAGTDPMSILDAVLIGFWTMAASLLALVVLGVVAWLRRKR